MGKIWNKNYILLLQGQLVSTFGDAIYSIALAFFVLKLTGSTVLMGTIMGIVTIPRIILGPFAGVVIDRYQKKYIIILSDAIRGVSIILLSFFAYKDLLEIWMLLAVAVITGIGTTFFNPTIEAIMPNMVSKEKLVQANSIMDMLESAVDIIGQMIGGFLYSLLGAPLIFLINGLTYIFSAGTETLISLPNNTKEKQENSFVNDMKEGMRYIWQNKGLSRLILFSFFINFLFGIIRVLIIPWFTYTDGFGETRYGFLNGACSVGLLLGMLILSFMNIKNEQKYRVYIFSVFMFIGLINVAAIANVFLIVLICFAMAFAFQVTFNMLLGATVMTKTSEDMRGKVSATKLTLGMAASPIGNFIGGILGEYMEPRYGIIVCSFSAFIISIILLRNSVIKEYMA